MNTIYYLAAAVVLAIIGAFVALTRREKRPPADPLEKLRSEIKKGIVFEDEFVDVYFRVIRDEGFMDYFGPDKEEAKTLLSTMIEESKGHKVLLENVMANLK